METKSFSPYILIVILAISVLLLGCAAPEASNTALQEPSGELALADPTETSLTTEVDPTPTTIPATIEAVEPTTTPTPITFVSEVDARLQRYNRSGMFSGAALVAQDGEVIFSKGYGLADKENDIPITPQTKFPIAAMTNQFTAMGILILQEQGRLDMQDLICTYLSNCPSTWEGITIHHLLTHTSGIPEYWGVKDDFEDTMGNPSSPEETLAGVVGLPLDFQPGENWGYSSSGYILLGLIIEEVSGQTYDIFLQENIFAPLNMKNTGYDHNVPGIAAGYDGTDTAAFIHNSIPFASGGLYSTVEDLLIWDQALYTEQLVPQEALVEMFTGYTASIEEGQDYGYGWFIGEDNGHRIVQHSGVLPGYISNIMRYVDDNVTVIVLSNQRLLPLHQLNANLGDLLFAYVIQ